MPVFNNMLAGASGGAGAGYEIERSLRFNSGDSAYLNRTPSAAGNRRTWTWSNWIKKSGTGTKAIISSHGPSDPSTYIGFSSDYLWIFDFNSGFNVQLISSPVFRDQSAWYHIVVVADTTQGTAANRLRAYVNGTEITSWSTSTYPTQNYEFDLNTSTEHRIGTHTTGYYLDGYLADVHFIDGQALAPTDFGETDTNGVWQPKKFAGTYTTHTVPVYNSTYGSDITSTEVAKTIDGDIATYGVPTGDFVGYTYSNTNDPIINIKWENTKGSAISVYIQPWVSGGAANAGTFASSGANSVTIAAGATLETTFTFPAGYDGYFRIYASGDGTNLRIYDVGGVTRAFNSFYLPFSDNSSSAQLGLDYSQGTPGTNNKGMEVVTYTGNGGTQSIDNLAFQPDFVWIKNRTAANGHVLSDVIRGATKFLRSDATDAEATNTTTLTSFDSNGFTVGNNAKTGATGSTYVAWAWKAGGAAVSNTDGTITSQVSANTTYGFSIAKYTGTGSNASFGHGLSSAPNFILVKKITAASWNVYHTDIGATKILELNDSGAETPTSSWNSTAPTSSVVSVGNYPDTNDNGGEYIAYCWSEVAGFSKFGSYTGNGSTDGPTVTLGFKPRYIILRSVSGSRSWCIYDTARDANATNDNNLFANNANAESSDPLHNITILDDGFKLATGNVDRNGNGETFVYAAFAANPANDWDVNNLSVASNIFSQTASGQNWMQYKATYNNNTVAQTKTGSRYRIALDDLFSGINDSTNYTGTQIFGITNFNAQGFIHDSLVSSDGTATTGFANSNNAGSVWKGYFNYPTNSGKYASIAMYDGSATDGADFPVDRSDNDSLVDSPTNGTQVDSGAGGEVVGNYATLNPLTLPGGGTLSNGNLKFSSGGDWDPISATIGVSSGKWYWEYMFEGTNMESGITAHPNTENWIGNYQGSVGIGNGAEKYVNGTSSNPSGWSTIATGSIVGNELDLDNGTFRHYINGVVAPSYAADSLDTSLTWFPAGSVYGSSNLTYNFGQRPFAYTAPSGYKALCTANLPEPTIADGSQYFDTKLYTGNSSTQSITGLNFSPDLVWVKARSASGSHFLYDKVRGDSQAMFTDQTTAEVDYSSGVGGLSLDSNGFSFLGSSIANVTNVPGVGWAWDAGSSNTTIAAGSLNSSAYNQSQTWSSNVSKGTGNVYSNNIYVPANIFDGNSSTYCKVEKGSNSNTVSFDLTSTISGVTSIRVQTSSVDNFSINGGSNIAATGGAYQTIYDGSAITLTSLKFIRTSGVSTGNSDTGLFITSIEINGSKLVDSGVTPATSVPSIVSTVRANPSAGFSCVSYSGNGSNDATIGHQLNAVPEFIIVKNRSNADDWFVYSLPTAGNILKLNGNDALLGSSHFRTISSSTFQLSGNADVNANGDNFIAYCFAPVEGYSAMGSFSTNGTADNAYVFTGFRPSFLMTKRTDGVGNWIIYDAKRDADNLVENRLLPNSSSAENTTNAGYDFLSNGFKVRTSVFASGQTHLYLAFAEHPFKTARAR